MDKIYVMSDIHGDYDAFNYALKAVDFNNQNKLILLGDYIDRGSQSLQVLEKIYELEKNYPDQVLTLLGNHELMFLNWLDNPADLMYAQGFYNLEYSITLISLTSVADYNYFSNLLADGEIMDASEYMANKVLEKHQYLIDWLEEKREELYYETKNQIFVHAGIDEEADEFWSFETDDDTLVWKYPATTGKFYKDIIAGHVSSDEVADDLDYLGKVYYDGQSHYFIDGNTYKSGIVPVLIYDVKANKYIYEK